MSYTINNLRGIKVSLHTDGDTNEGGANRRINLDYEFTWTTELVSLIITEGVSVGGNNRGSRPAS